MRRHGTGLPTRETELLPVGYFHVVFTLPAQIAEIAFQNKALVYDLLFRAAAETLLTIAADPRHLGARIGVTAVLHSWGSAMTHHPHVHMHRPGRRLVARRLALDFLSARLSVADALPPVPPAIPGRDRRRPRGGPAGLLRRSRRLARGRAFAAQFAPLRRKNWLVYAKPPFAGREAVLTYLARYTHRVAISNSCLLALEERGVTFRYKDYRRTGRAPYRTMTLTTDELIRSFLLHVAAHHAEIALSKAAVPWS